MYCNWRAFDFVIKRTPVAIQILEVTKIKAGSPSSNRKKVGSIDWNQIKKIAEDKIVDMNCFTVESAMFMVAGPARSMGVTVTGDKPSKN